MRLPPIFRNILFVVVIAAATLSAGGDGRTSRSGGGNFNGTVSFGIRSLRLRHDRGPSIRSRSASRAPFSLSGAVQNLGRDWIIGKIALGVIYDSDLTLAKTLIRQIGLDLSAPLILEPPKMQGVDPLGDFVVRIRAKDRR